MNKIQRLLITPFRHLRWKLTLSYTVVTVAALMVVEFVIIVTFTLNLARDATRKPEVLIEDMKSNYARIVNFYLSQVPPDVDGLREYLGQLRAAETVTDPIRLGNFWFTASSTNLVEVVFLTENGELIDTLPHDILTRTAIGERFDPREIPGIEGPVSAAMAGETDFDNLHSIGDKNRVVGALPVFWGDPQLGYLESKTLFSNESDEIPLIAVIAFVQKASIWDVWTFSQIVRQIGVSFLFVMLFTALLGTAFGLFTARGLVGRLKALLASADAWSGGDFSVNIEDSGGDELGRLASGLNQMAAKLESLLEEREQMSVVSERNRLARELHDSVKQQAFAASAQLAAARTHFKMNPEEAGMHLIEAERLVDEVRRDLTGLIEELRPVTLQNRGLAAALRDYAKDCGNQAGIDIEVRVQGERSMPIEVEQTLFRIAQGALSNVARHSQAGHADVRLIYGNASLTLRVSDDGCGFDARQRRNSLGLRSIRERADQIHGELEIQSEVGEGTTITVTCPYPPGWMGEPIREGS